MIAQRAQLPKSLALVCAALVIAGMPFWFAGAGLEAYFTTDDTMNLYGYWSKPWRDLLIANLTYYSPFYRPLGGLFYRSMFAAFGFHPFPFRVACFAVMLLNLGLLYATARLLAGSREAGLLAALIGCYHAGHEDLYYNTGAIYDLLCFSFYVGALLLYIRTRRDGRRLRWPGIMLLVALYICALNAKEMAVTLPVAILIYEWIYHRPEFTKRNLLRWIVYDARVACLLAALTVPYLYGKLSSASVFSRVADYGLHITLGRYLGAYQQYLDWMFYQRTRWFTLSAALLLWAAMLSIAALSRRKALWFSFLFVLFSVLPVMFIAPRGSIFVLYVPFLGWSLYGAALLILIRNSLGAGLARLAPGLAGMLAGTQPVMSGMTFTIAAASLFLVHQAHSFPVPQDSLIRSTTEQIHTMLPQLPANSRILFLDDPFSTDNWIPLVVIRLSYGDGRIQVDRVKRMKHRPDLSQIRRYNVVLTYQDKRLVRIEPAQLGRGSEPR
jgi:hypothetical protein